MCCPRSVGGGRGRKDQTRPGRVQLEAGQRGLRGCSFLHVKTKTQDKDKEASEVVLIYLQRQRQKQRGLRGCSFLHVETKTQDKDKEASEVVLKSIYKVCHTKGNFLHKIDFPI